MTDRAELIEQHGAALPVGPAGTAPPATLDLDAPEPSPARPPAPGLRERWQRQSSRARRTELVAAFLVLALVAGLGSVNWYRARNVHRKLLSAAVGLGDGGRWVNVPQGTGPGVFLPGTRVVHDSTHAGARAQAQQDWLREGTIPGSSQAWTRPMVTDALLDLDTLTAASGASIAGGPSIWRYVWPRDAAFAAVALAVTSHEGEAEKILRYLQDLPAPDGLFQARYLPNGSGPPDARGIQTDSTGWVLWAIDMTVQQLDEANQVRLLSDLHPLINRMTIALLRLTAAPDELPPPSQDYWEVTDDRLSLGTVAPLALGLASATRLEQARLAAGPGAIPALADLTAELNRRVAVLYGSITSRFGPDYPRYLGGHQQDAALTFLLPPFTGAADPAVLRAWKHAQTQMNRPAGGLAPGVGWKNDGISWTPETALAALSAAATGDTAQAVSRLHWLDAHRTTLGALPEKVLSDGAPAGPAPLAWTAALVVLTAYTLDRQQATPPPWVTQGTAAAAAPGS